MRRDIDPQDYHDRTKHRPERYAASLGYMDWANQPDPFRRFEGAPLRRLSGEAWEGPRFGDVVAGSVRPEPLDFRFLDRLLFLSFALSAWKAIPGSRWSLRVNPSSGNLHPTEAYLLVPLPETPTLYHYAPHEHGLEERARLGDDSWAELTRGLPDECMFIGLTSIHWREAWKYGERAYRYCQHDAGHAIGAVAYAAACLGWRAQLLTAVTDSDLAELLGVANQSGAEAEHADCLMVLHAANTEVDLERFAIPAGARADVTKTLSGEPNKLCANYHSWPVIDEVATACLKTDSTGVCETGWENARGRVPGATDSMAATTVIRNRRSAVAMDGRTSIDRATFYRMLDRTLAGEDRIPHAVLPWRPRIHLALFVHRVDGLPPGLYMLERSGDPGLRSFLGADWDWRTPEGCPDHLSLFFVNESDARPTAKASSCHQDIAADGCFAVAMLGEFEESIRTHGPWFYRALHWESGVIGQTLYLEAERAGIRSTGIGCFFDDLTHEVVDYEGHGLQVIYHFTVGGAVDDERLQTLPAYEHLGPDG